MRFVLSGLEATEALTEWGAVLRKPGSLVKQSTWTDAMKLNYTALVGELQAMVYPLRQRPQPEQDMLLELCVLYTKTFQALRDVTGKVYRGAGRGGDFDTTNTE